MGLLSAMYEDDADFTNTFRALGSITSQPADSDEDGVPAPLLQVRSRARCCVFFILTHSAISAWGAVQSCASCAPTQL